MICFTFFSMKNCYFFSTNIYITNTTYLRTCFNVKNKHKNVKNETRCMLKIKKGKYIFWENP